MKADLYADVPKVLMLWKLGDSSEANLLVLTPITPDVQRWTGVNLDFVAMPLTSVWLAPRIATRDGTAYELKTFNTLDLEDLGAMRISIQQVMAVSRYIPEALRVAYFADVNPDLLVAGVH